MATKFSYILGFILILSLNSFSQPNIKFFTTISYNNYSMNGLKRQQNEILGDIIGKNIPAKITESYPAFYGFKVGFLIPIIKKTQNTFLLGPLLQHSSTGGRIHYQDYSGELLMDQLVSTTGIGAVIQYEIHYPSKFNLGLNFTVNYLFSAFSNQAHYQIGDEIQNQTLDFSSSSFGLEPEIIPSFQFGMLQIGVSFSYLLYITSELEYDQYSDAFLVYKDGSRVNINWSGFRAGIFMSISL